MARYCLLFILSLMVAMGGHSLQAADPPNFSGTWTLDLNAPESIPMYAMFEALGVSLDKTKSRGHHGRNPGDHPDQEHSDN